MFEKGDKLMLVDKFYENPLFENYTRFRRKRTANLKGQVLTYESRAIRVGSFVIGEIIVMDESGKYYVLHKELVRPVSSFETAAEDLKKAVDNVVNAVSEGVCEMVNNIDFDLLRRVTEQIEPAKRQWTDEEIADAQRIIGEIVADVDVVKFYDNLFRSRESLVYVNGAQMKGVATCSTRDEYNQKIGRMVALCKATGRKLPEWVKR